MDGPSLHWQSLDNSWTPFLLLDATLGDLGIDDDPPLTQQETAWVSESTQAHSEVGPGEGYAVYLNHAEFPDGTPSSNDVKRLPSISHEQMTRLLELILQAQRPGS